MCAEMINANKGKVSTTKWEKVQRNCIWKMQWNLQITQNTLRIAVIESVLCLIK